MVMKRVISRFENRDLMGWKDDLTKKHGDVHGVLAANMVISWSLTNGHDDLS
jgi:hypothetical protein